MARPRSEDKRNAILAAAVRLFAEQGVSAPTAKIAKGAGVAEGTLFTYFSNKDELLNELYVALKEELREAMMSDYPRTKSTKIRARHVWKRYVAWGVEHAEKRKVMAQLSLSERVSDHSKARSMQTFSDINSLLHESVAQGVLREHPPGFVAAIMGSLAETTMDFMSREPARAELYGDSGFEAFWNAISKK